MENIIFFSILEKIDDPLNSWKQILKQEKINFRQNIYNNTKIIITNDFNDRKDELLNFVEHGGVCLLQQPRDIKELDLYVDEKITVNYLNFPEYAIANANYPTTAYSYQNIFCGNDTIGYYDTFEKRISKNSIKNGAKPIFIRISFGSGFFYVSTIDFSDYLNYNGNTLRKIRTQFSSTEVTERINQIDKGTITYSLIKVLKEITRMVDIPWINFSYYPEGAFNIFIMRIDVDGSEPGIIKRISDLGDEYGIPITFYMNKQLIENSSVSINELKEISDLHDIGNHSVIHNAYDTDEENKNNIKNAEIWIRQNIREKMDGFAAPRGIWNNSIERALSELSYDYSSDFGFVSNGLPIRPYIQGKQSKILQVPVNPYNIHRAEIYYNRKKDYLSDEDILEYYFSHINETQSKNGDGFIHIFGHPLGLGKRIELLEAIFKHLQKSDVLKMTIREFVDWWKYRESSEYKLYYEKGEYKIKFLKNPIVYKFD